jgi:hypothetical protein
MEEGDELECSSPDKTVRRHPAAPPLLASPHTPAGGDRDQQPAMSDGGGEDPPPPIVVPWGQLAALETGRCMFSASIMFAMFSSGELLLKVCPSPTLTLHHTHACSHPLSLSLSPPSLPL